MPRPARLGGRLGRRLRRPGPRRRHRVGRARRGGLEARPRRRRLRVRPVPARGSSGRTAGPPGRQQLRRPPRGRPPIRPGPRGPRGRPARRDPPGRWPRPHRRSRPGPARPPVRPGRGGRRPLPVRPRIRPPPDGRRPGPGPLGRARRRPGDLRQPGGPAGRHVPGQPPPGRPVRRPLADHAGLAGRLVVGRVARLVARPAGAGIGGRTSGPRSQTTWNSGPIARPSARPGRVAARRL